MTGAKPLPSATEVVVVGAGQSGLSMSWYLRACAIPHVVLERHVAAHSWRSERWDSFCLVTPNWQCRLPGHPYSGPDPAGFMGKDEIIDYLDRFVASFDPPLHEGVDVRRVAPAGRGFRVETSTGSILAHQVVVAIGGYQTPIVADGAERLGPACAQFDPATYRSPAQLPPGAVLVVGSGQSGAQIAEELHLAGRRVHLCVGSAPRISRAYRGRDVAEWLQDMGFYDMPVAAHARPDSVRDIAEPYVSGRDGGRDIDLRRHARDGMVLHGRLLAIEDGVARLGSDLAANLDAADAANAAIKRTIDAWITGQGLTAPDEALYVPPWAPRANAPRRLDLEAAEIRAIVWCIGFRADFTWIDAPVFDARGRPRHDRGVTETRGLYFLGLPWMHSWGSGRMSGVARDAAFLADRIATLADAPPLHASPA